MKLKKLIFYITIFVSVFLIYRITFKDTVNYISIGDFLAEGINPYGEIGYGYSDYLADYFRSNDKLGFYVNEFSNKDYTIDDIINDIFNNKTVLIKTRKHNIKKLLRESTLVTISIGANDIINSISYKDMDNKEVLKSKVDSITKKLNSAIKLIKKYAKGDIILLGYYNPYNSDIYDFDDLICYIDQKYYEVSEKNNIKFISIKNVLDNKKKYFPNPNSIYPSTEGYMKIYEQIKKELQK